MNVQKSRDGRSRITTFSLFILLLGSFLERGRRGFDFLLLRKKTKKVGTLRQAKRQSGRTTDIVITNGVDICQMNR